MKRAAKKLTPISFIHGILCAAASGQASFRLLATAIGMRLDPIQPPGALSPSFQTISKQALWERVDATAVSFFKATLEELMRSKGFSVHPIPNLPSVKRVIIEDSTKIDLPAGLADEFPATSNQHGHCGAGLRLQGAFDLLNGEVIRLELTKYLRQDTVAAQDIVPFLQPGDLVIRDLGYLVASALIAIMEEKAFFLSRYQVGRVLYYKQSEGGGRIELARLLRDKAANSGDKLDIDVLLGDPRGKTPQVSCRLVAVRLPKEAVEKRLRRLNREQKRKGKQVSAEVKTLIGWTILLTNLPREEADANRLTELYMLRWRVEIIFKSLKSYTPGKLLASHRSNKHHIQTLLYAWLCLIVVATKTGAFALVKASGAARAVYNPLSLLKIMPKVFELLRITLWLACDRNLNSLLERWLLQIEYHDRYEKRQNRINMAEMAAKTLGFDLANPTLHAVFPRLT